MSREPLWRRSGLTRLRFARLIFQPANVSEMLGASRRLLVPEQGISTDERSSTTLEFEFTGSSQRFVEGDRPCLENLWQDPADALHSKVFGCIAPVVNLRLRSLSSSRQSLRQRRLMLVMKTSNGRALLLRMMLCAGAVSACGGAAGDDPDRVSIDDQSDPDSQTTGEDPSNGSACQLPVTFVDPAFDAAMRLYLGQEGSTGEFVLEDLESLPALYLGNAMIQDLSGIECLTNLTLIEMAGNQVSDLTPLSSLTKLEHIALSDNVVSDASALSSLTNLKRLYLSNNGLTDISVVPPLPALTELDLSGNQIASVTGMSEFPQLSTLNLAGNQLATLEGLAELPSLRILYAHSNQLTDASGLATMTNVRTLYLSNNRIESLAPFAGLTSLTELLLDSNEVASLVPLLDNAGLGSGDQVDLIMNPFEANCESVVAVLQELRARDVSVNTNCDIDNSLPPPDGPPPQGQ